VFDDAFLSGRCGLAAMVHNSHSNADFCGAAGRIAVVFRAATVTGFQNISSTYLVVMRVLDIDERAKFIS
jgi:hypothetical protein